MRMRGVEWGRVFNASGARGFRGEGYWFHDLWRHLGLRWEGSTLVTKTTTLLPRAGNMPLNDDQQPKALLPDCIVVKPAAGVVLNAVGLSGPGAAALLSDWSMGVNGRRALLESRLQETRARAMPMHFVISFMSVAADAASRLDELSTFVKMLWTPLRSWQRENEADFPPTSVALQLNFSCPNVGLDTSHLVQEISDALDVTSVLNIPVMVKISALVPPAVACEIAEKPGCDAIVCSNTIPWGQLPEEIPWAKLFGSTTSPLAKYGGGGLSGRPLLPVVAKWLCVARAMGLEKPVVAGGGVLSRAAADVLVDCGASAIELGSVAILRPWRVAGLIAYLNRAAWAHS